MAQRHHSSTWSRQGIWTKQRTAHGPFTCNMARHSCPTSTHAYGPHSVGPRFITVFTWTMDQCFFSKFTRTTHTNSSTSALSHVDGKFPIRASLQLYLKSFKQPEQDIQRQNSIPQIGEFHREAEFKISISI
ncbi:uncharacterized protein LOC122721753 [Manihot esculenta]|uniref:uncharacterized protein LOC122721753 n=1 Tax=Manihot esculenta TaxID=3983 RepID=UPI001CC4C207|nr:uncharacterized protein LOC122721753 [Manihot esculenta]